MRHAPLNAHVVAKALIDVENGDLKYALTPVEMLEYSVPQWPHIAA